MVDDIDEVLVSMEHEIVLKVDIYVCEVVDKGVRDRKEVMENVWEDEEDIKILKTYSVGILDIGQEMWVGYNFYKVKKMEKNGVF